MMMKNFDICRSWKLLKRFLNRKSLRPRIADIQGTQSLDEADHTFVMLVSPEFDSQRPNASMTARLGWCHGFEDLGIPYRVISIFDLDKRLPSLPRPFCWISESDYCYLTPQNILTLRNYPHFVWINVWFKNDKKYFDTYNFPDFSGSLRVKKKVIASEPTFVFTISPKDRFYYYEEWMKRGLMLSSLPLAWDKKVYPEFPEPDKDFENVKIAFVGGYWAYKARQFDRYLKPYANQLMVFGYTTWPYGNYGGLLPRWREASLYRQARVSPTINEPHVEKMGIDQNERIFKVLGSGGFTITDAVSGYRHWFTEDELLVPTTVEEFHELVQMALRDDEFNQRYRVCGQRAVKERHQYSHRAMQALKILMQDSRWQK
jgi:hypothetical protein